MKGNYYHEPQFESLLYSWKYFDIFVTKAGGGESGFGICSGSGSSYEFKESPSVGSRSRGTSSFPSSSPLGLKPFGVTPLKSGKVCGLEQPGKKGEQNSR